MRATREDWTAARTRLRQEAVKARLPELRSIAQAVVEEGRLTGSPEWDSFLRIAQAMREEAQDAYEACRDQLADGEYLSADQLVSIKFQAERARVRAETLDDMMAIPKQMKEQGGRAIEILRGVADAG